MLLPIYLRRFIPKLQGGIILIVAVSLSTASFAQGLLGHRYLLAGYEAQRPNSKSLRSISSWSHGVNVEGNLPLTESVDWVSRLSTQSFEGGFSVSGTPVNADARYVQLDTMLTKHFLPESNIDPYVSLGIGYAESSIEFTSNVVDLYSEGDDFGIGWRAGFELIMTESTALQIELSGADSLDSLDLTDTVVENLFFDTRIVHWWSDNFFAGGTIGSDFDDTEVALGFFFGFGQ